MNLFNVFKRKTKPTQVYQDHILKIPTAKGTFVSEDETMKIAAFYRGVIYISSQIAKLPMEVKNLQRENQRGDIWRILNRAPNPEMSAYTFKLMMLQWALVRGNAYAEIVRDNVGKVRQLWPILPQFVKPHRLPDGKLVYRVTGTPQGSVYLRPDEVFHVKNLHTKDGITGLGLSEYGEEILGISRGADIYANSTYANGGRPSGAIEVPGKLTDESAGRMQKSWDEAHGGRKTGGTAVLEQGAKYTPFSHDQKSLQFIESRKFGVVEIARFLGLPPTKLFDTESQKFKNIEHANLEVVTDTLDAWARNFESETDNKLVRRTDHYSEMDLYAVFRGDMKTRAEYFNLQIQDGAITPNEIREKEGRPDYKEGDKFYIATNNLTPADRVDDVIDSQTNKDDDNNDNEEIVDQLVNKLESSEFREALKGARGQKGKRGESVFDIWKKYHDGNEEDFLNWVKETKC